jgi:Protein of unknown function (DUF2795)
MTERPRSDERRFGRGRYPHHVVALGRWVNPAVGVLGALVLGYLIAGYLSTTVDAGGESTFSSMTDLLKAACAAAIALTWAVFGTRLVMRRTQRPNSFDEPANATSTTVRPTGTACESLRVPTCERMYDKTRLVPQYLRSAHFPATKHELVRLAREHTDEGQALRRLERIPDRRYSCLHDLISEIRCD